MQLEVNEKVFPFLAETARNVIPETFYSRIVYTPEEM